MKTKNLTLLLAISLFCKVFSGPIENLRPGEWYEVPNSHLSDHKVNLPAMTNVLQLPTGANKFSAIMANWCGGAMDTKRSRLLIWGGGHGSYAGNEVYGFDIPTLTWVSLTDPSPVLNWCNGQVNPDGQPTARHSYGSMTYVEHMDHMYGSGASVSCSRGGRRRASQFHPRFNHEKVDRSRKHALRDPSQRWRRTEFSLQPGGQFCVFPYECGRVVRH